MSLRSREDDEGVAVHDGAVVTGAQLGGQLAGAAAEQRGQLLGVVVDQAARDDGPTGVPVGPSQGAGRVSA